LQKALWICHVPHVLKSHHNPSPQNVHPDALLILKKTRKMNQLRPKEVSTTKMRMRKALTVRAKFSMRVSAISPSPEDPN
jgi:hypothetical protein